MSIVVSVGLYFEYSSTLDESVPVTPCGEINTPLVADELRSIKCSRNPSPQDRFVIIKKLGSKRLTLSYPCEIEVYGTEGKSH